MESKTVQLDPGSSTSRSDSHVLPANPYSGANMFGRSDAAETDSIAADDDDDSGSITDSAIGNGVPTNPSDAWQCLKGIAKRGTDGVDPDTSQGGGISAPGAASVNGSPNGTVDPGGGIKAYPLVQNGSLSPETVFELVARFAKHFYPYLPLVPRKYFDRSNLDEFASTEKHLLTAVLTIASKDLVKTPEIHEYCSKYMHELISGIAAGADCDVEAVEALLLLAEWEPQGLRPRVEHVGRGEEDRAAWMHIGLALRSGYFVGLDRTSFRGDSGDSTNDARKRLAWANCYISDRLISVRIGRAFWSRGPGPMTGLVSQDFPSLQPMEPDNEDYARIFQATLDLTQLYSNVHDVLYSGMRTSNHMMLMGDYVKYADDFRAGISRWEKKWGSLNCSEHIKTTLRMSYEYLRLYTNAFAFQAAISQASKRKNDDPSSALSQKEHLRTAFSNVASMPDARFIYESVEAAKSYLKILVESVDPEEHLHYMPLRYYLYSIYAAVFLYKARSFGVVQDTEDTKEETFVRHLVAQTTERLKRASAGPDDLGSRYARLLELLWRPRSAPTVGSPEIRLNNEMELSTTMAGLIPDANYMNLSPANDFSWLDLEGVGNFVSGTGVLGVQPFFPTGQDRAPMWQPPFWAGDMAGSLLF
jgi:hypothetical protein